MIQLVLLKIKNIFDDILCVIKYIDSKNDLIDLSIKINISIKKIYEIIEILLQKNLIDKLLFNIIIF